MSPREWRKLRDETRLQKKEKNMEQENDGNFELGPLDAAIILRNDGTLEACMPDLSQPDLPENVILGTALIVALQDPEVLEILQKKLAESCADSQLIGANDD